MKLSTIPLMGATVVRGTRLLRVLHDHDVDTKGSGFHDMEGVGTVEGAAPIAKTSPQAGRDTARAVAGDLAVELMTLTSGEILGYSYLTGEAITCNSYELAPHRFESARLERMFDLEALIRDASAITSKEDFDRHISKMIGACQKRRHSDLDVAIFEVVVGDDYARVAEAVMNFWSKYEPNDMTGLPSPDQMTCHLMGCVWRRKQKTPGVLSFRKKAEKHCLMHLQPPRHASDHAATSFQFRVLLDLADRRMSHPTISTEEPADTLRGEPSTSG